MALNTINQAKPNLKALSVQSITETSVSGISTYFDITVRYDDTSQEVETTDSDNVGLLTMIDIDKDWQRLDKHERKVVKMVNYDLDKIDDSDRQVPDSDVEKDKGTVFDCDITLHNSDGDKTFWHRIISFYLYIFMIQKHWIYLTYRLFT